MTHNGKPVLRVYFREDRIGQHVRNITVYDYDTDETLGVITVTDAMLATSTAISYFCSKEGVENLTYKAEVQRHV